MRAWGKANAERRRMLEFRRQVRKRSGGVFQVEPSDLLRIQGRQQGRCFYCGQRMGDRQQWDHVEPIARGGRHSIGNLVLACGDCNASKGASYVTEWRLRLARNERAVSCH